jgi:soluble lytic murein transglycosylase-like protein
MIPPVPPEPAGLSRVRARISSLQERFGGPPRTSFSEALSAATGAPSAEVQRALATAAEKHGVDPALLSALAATESGFNPSAVSSKGALGLLQLMPGTAARLGVQDAFDPVANADAGAGYLREQLDRFGDVRLALAAYNAGPEAVQRYGTVPPYAETQRFVQRILDRTSLPR